MSEIHAVTDREIKAYQAGVQKGKDLATAATILDAIVWSQKLIAKNELSGAVAITDWAKDAVTRMGEKK
jgi:hypothetical protein